MRGVRALAPRQPVADDEPDGGRRRAPPGMPQIENAPRLRMEVERLAIAVSPGMRSPTALVALPVSVRARLLRLVEKHGPGGTPSRRALAIILGGCSPRVRRQAMSWLLQGHVAFPVPLDLRLQGGRPGRTPGWIPLRSEPESPWFIDYLLPEQIDRLCSGRHCRRLPDGSVVLSGARGWRLNRTDLRRYLLMRDGSTCALCGRVICRQPTVEHLIPRALAPLWSERDPLPAAHRLWAMAPAHRRCNEARGCAPHLPECSANPQVRLSRWALSRLLPGSVSSVQEVSGFVQLAHLLTPDQRRPAWRYLRRLWVERPAALAHIYRNRILAYRGGRVLALPAALGTPEAVAWLRAQLRAGRAPVPQSVVALGRWPAQHWRLACTRLHFL